MKIEDRMKDFYENRSRIYLPRKNAVIIRVDGNCFSKLIKNKYEKPFDDKFIEYMNNCAIKLCKEIQGAKYAFVQSDEISVLITDYDTIETDAWFDYNVQKMASISAAKATSEFNRQVLCDIASSPASQSDIVTMMQKYKTAEFDARCFIIPQNEIVNYFIWRQQDCIRNSKQQAAQTYLPHKNLINKNTEQQIEMLKAETGIDWNEYDDGKKYGRLIYKESVKFEGFERNVMKSHYATPFTDKENIIYALTNNINERDSIK